MKRFVPYTCIPSVAYKLDHFTGTLRAIAPFGKQHYSESKKSKVMDCKHVKHGRLVVKEAVFGSNKTLRYVCKAWQAEGSQMDALLPCGVVCVCSLCWQAVAC